MTADNFFSSPCPIQDTSFNNITLYFASEPVGKLNFKDGKLWFEGDAEKSAEVFFDHLIAVNDRKIAALVAENEELRAKLSTLPSAGEAEPWTRYDLAKGLAMFDGVTLRDVKSTVGDPKDTNNWRWYLGRADDLLAHLSASAHPSPSASEAQVRVKALEWREHPNAFPAPTWSAQTPFGFYNIEELSASDSPAFEVRLHAHHLISVKDSLDEAKAAAQRDFERRILSCLSTPEQGETPPSPETHLRAIDWRQSCGHLLNMIHYLREATGETLEEDDAAIYEEIGSDYATTPDHHVSANLWDQLVVLSGYYITRPPTSDHEFVRVCNGDLRKMVELMQRTPSPQSRATPPSPSPSILEPEQRKREYPELLTKEEHKELLSEAEELWKDLQRNDLGGFSDGNRPFWVLYHFKRVIEKFGRRDVGLTWSKNDLDAAIHRLAEQEGA